MNAGLIVNSHLMGNARVKKTPNNNNNIKALRNWSGSGVCGSRATRHALKSETGSPGAGGWLWGSSCHDSIRPSQLKDRTPTCLCSSRFGVKMLNSSCSVKQPSRVSFHARQSIPGRRITANRRPLAPSSTLFLGVFLSLSLSFLVRYYKRTTNGEKNALVETRIQTATETTKIWFYADFIFPLAIPAWSVRCVNACHAAFSPTASVLAVK